MVKVFVRIWRPRAFVVKTFEIQVNGSDLHRLLTPGLATVPHEIWIFWHF